MQVYARVRVKYSCTTYYSLADKATRLSKRRRIFSKYLQIKSWVLIYAQNLPHFQTQLFFVFRELN